MWRVPNQRSTSSHGSSVGSIDRVAIDESLSEASSSSVARDRKRLSALWSRLSYSALAAKAGGSAMRSRYHMRRMATAAPARATLIDFFHDATQRTGPFLVHDDGYRTWTFRYDEVGRAARRLAGRLHAAGLVKGDAVVLWGENRPEWIVAFWACLLRGIVVVPIDYR